MLHDPTRLPAERNPSVEQTIWESDIALSLSLQQMLSDAARIGRGARLVLSEASGRQLVLASPAGLRYPWRSLVAKVLEHGTVEAQSGIVAVPVLASRDMRGALLLYHHPHVDVATTETVALALAARVEVEMAASMVRLSSTSGYVDGLAQMLAAYDPDTARHSKAVRRLARAIGQAARLSSSQLLELEWAAALHDVGKVSVPLAVLHKTGPLTALEWGLMRQHPTIGERIVRPVPSLAAVALAIRHHHERWDGAGYPDRLAGESIPLTSRLVGMVDAYETMRAGRPYRAPFSRDEAIRELEGVVGRQFDPAILDLLPVLHICDRNL